MTGKITSDMYVEIKQNHMIKLFSGLPYINTEVIT